MENSSPVVNTLVNVGDYRLHFRVYPGSEPAVLLESGGGADASYWDVLAPILARETGAAIITYETGPVTGRVTCRLRRTTSARRWRGCGAG